jgi:ComF family protein
VNVAEWGADLLDVLMPAGCVACHSWIPGGLGAPLVCERCRSRLRSAPWPRCARCHYPRGAGRTDTADCLECRDWAPTLTAARYAYVLEPPASDLAHALKYEGWPELADAMGRAMARLDLPKGAPRRTFVVPVPTTAKRRRSRGYNQAELLARQVAARRGWSLLLALARVGEAGSQTSLSPTERRENVRGAFAPAGDGSRKLAGAHVVLVDDVLTTGATASEAAETLAEMGADGVTLVAFARALPTGPRGRI